NARTCYDFARTMQRGDRVFVKRGRNTIIGHGVVTGHYEHHPSRANFTNVRTIRWEGRGSWPSPAPLAIKSLTDVSDAADFVAALDQAVSGPQAEPPKPVPPAVRVSYTVEQGLEGLFMAEEHFRQALVIWRQKKNLILQGPPGVGKSFVARR